MCPRVRTLHGRSKNHEMPNSPYLDASVRWRIRAGRLEMEEPGYDDGPAPRLVDVRLEDPEPLLQEILAGIETMARAGVVHTDFSASNILVYDGHPFFIDFSEALRVDRTGTAPWIRLTEASAMLEHGLNALGKYFRRYGLSIEVAPFVDRIVDSLDRFRVLRRPS